MHRADAEYYVGYALTGGGALLLVVTVMAWHDERMLRPLRYLLAASVAALLLAVLLGYIPIRWTLPHGQFV